MRWLERRGRTGAAMANHLYYGDNLDVLRESIRDESVDLIYLDPPFNSNATYNILFRAPSGEASQQERRVQ
jgi:site-specific DNA-methyltransferase (adenine-specific)